MAEFKKEQLIDHIRDMMESSKEMIDGNGVPVEFVVRAERDIAVYEIALAVLTAGMEQEPVAWQWLYRGKCHVTNDPDRAKFVDEDDDVTVQPLYAAPQLPQPAVPDEWRMMCGEWRDETVSIHDASGLIVSGISPNAAGIIIEAHNTCRAAMLQGAEPVQGWIPCSERMPEFYFSVLATDEHEDMVIALPVRLDAGDRCAFQLSDGDIFIATHWMPLPAAPQQEVK